MIKRQNYINRILFKNYHDHFYNLETILLISYMHMIFIFLLKGKKKVSYKLKCLLIEESNCIN